MLMGGDYNLNSSQVHTDSFKEILRQTMLNQEVIFRRQGGSTQSIQNSSTQQGRDSCYRLYQRPKMPQSLSSNCINYIDSDISVAGYNRDCIENSNKREDWIPDDDSYCPEEVKLSLSIGGSSTKKVVGRQFLSDKNSCASSPEIIDLEEPANMLSDYNNQPVFLKYGQVTSGHKKDAQVPLKYHQKVTDVMVKDRADSYLTPHSCIGNNNVSQERNLSKRGLDECYGDVPGVSMFAKGKLFTSNVAIDLDLNKIQLDESSTQSNNSLLGYTSAASTRGLKDPNGNNSGHVSEIIFKSKAKDGNRTCSIHLESMSELQSRHQPGNHSRNMDIQINFHCGNNLDTPQFEENGRKKNEDIKLGPSYRSQSATGDSHCSRRSSSCKSDCIDDLSVTRTMHSGTDLERVLSSSSVIQNAESSQVAENACPLDWSSFGISKTKLQACDKKKEKSADIDALIQDAAASLISISLESPINNPACPTKSRSNDIHNIVQEQPEYSSDSYESMVMKLTETNADDYCVSSNPFEVNEPCNKDIGIKLRRGRRLKDFKKDILPGMASLSRQEICEDINIMEGVLRSREYKRLRSKMANVGNWFTPVRSRRSKLNYVGRRNYQW